MLRLIASSALTLLLGACAGSGMDKAECLAADWRAIGYEDGSRGLSGTGKACADHGVTPDFAAYMDGQRQGITVFCRPQNGYRLGTGGYRYRGVCPADLEGPFLAAHADGMGLYNRRVAVDRLRSLINRKHNRSNTVERLIAKKTAALVSPLTPPPQRLTLGVELKQLTEERIEIDREIGRLEIDLAHAEQDYRGYSESIAHR